MSGAFQIAAGFAAIFLCLWRGVDVSLIYHGGGEIQDFPVFYWGWSFAREFLGYPGGWADYVSALQMQSLFHSWFGALVLTLQSGVLYASMRICVKRMNIPHSEILAFLAPVLLLGSYARYGQHAQAAMNLTFVSVSLGWFTSFSPARPWIRVVGLGLLTALLYPAAAGAGMVFSLTMALLEWHRTRQWLMVVAALGLGIVLPLLEGWLWFGLAPVEVVRSLLPVPWKTLYAYPRGLLPLGGLFLLLPGFGLLAMLRHPWQGMRLRWRQAPAPEKPVRPTKGKSPDGGTGLSRESRKLGKTKSQHLGQQVVRWGGPGIAQTLVLVATVVGTFLGMHNRQFKPVLAVDYLASHQRWPEVLAAVQGMPYDPFIACTAVQAAFHTGQLTGQLPALKNPDDLLLLPRKIYAHWKQSGLYLDLGYVNLALHHLAEAVEAWGERPLLLRRLVVANLAVGNLPTAKIYLNALTRVPFHSQWAQNYLQRLVSDPDLDTDEEVMRLRNLMVKKDLVGTFSADSQFLLLLDSNGQNRMAFEYLMTYYLLTKNLAGFVKHLPRARDFPGFPIPPLWEEAVMIHTQEQNQNSSAQSPRFSPELQRRLDHIRQVFAANGGNIEITRDQLKGDYGNSYFFYYLFRR